MADERGRERYRQTDRDGWMLHLLVHSLTVQNCQDWIRLKPRVRISIWVFHKGGMTKVPGPFSVAG